LNLLFLCVLVNFHFRNEFLLVLVALFTLFCGVTLYFCKHVASTVMVEIGITLLNLVGFI
jgi:hypothetical protein